MLTLRNKLILGYLILLAILGLAAWAAIFTDNHPLIVVLILCAVAFGGMFILALGRWILNPLRTLTGAVRQFEGGGPAQANFPAEVAGNDEISRLAQSFHAMAARLREFRRQDQERVVRTQETTRAAINSLPHGVAVLSPEGRIELVNQVAEKLFGLAPGQEAPAGKMAWLMPLLEEATRSKQAVEPRGFGSAVQVFDGGREFFFLPHAIPILDAQRRIVGITILLVDATQLRQIDEAKSGLLSTVSHELKTPLTSIQMALHLLREDPPAGFSAKQMELLKTACEDADRLHDLIQNILDAGRRGTPTG